MEKLYSIQEASEKLGGISVFTVNTWMSRGHKVFGRLQRTKVGSRTFLRESELERFITACNQPSAAQTQESRQ